MNDEPRCVGEGETAADYRTSGEHIRRRGDAPGTAAPATDIWQDRPAGMRRERCRLRAAGQPLPAETATAW
jgi:hypothetical protein